MRIPPRTSLLVLSVAVTLACSGRAERADQAPTPTNPITGSSAVHTKDDVIPPVVPGTCTIGPGDPDAACSDGGVPGLLPAVDAAIDELIQKRPELFDLNRVMGSNGYLVRDTEGFYVGVAAILQAKGLCAEWDFTYLHVKDDQDHSEAYDLILSNGHIRRGAGSFRSTCVPASFPLTPAQVISRVRVAFYSITCEDGRTPPRNGEDLLPVDCNGYVTATPKKKDETDVDKRIHGPEILWELETDGGDLVTIEDFPKVDFNKVLRGRDPGGFRLCATVQTHKGCLNGTVIP